MRNYYILLILLSSILLSGCESKQLNPEISANIVDTNEPIKETVQVTDEISNPDFILSADINPSQIVKYFMKDDVYYALVLQPSMNVLLTLPSNFKSTFVGVLRARKSDKAWSKYIEIKDVNPADKNNPYYLWLTKDQIRLTVVDQNGAGSGEGLMKVFKIENNKAELIGCYYYSGSDSANNYFSNTKNLSKFESQSMESCTNADIKIF